MGIEKGKREGFISRGSSVVLLSGWRPDPDRINTIRIIKVEQCNIRHRLFFLVYINMILIQFTHRLNRLTATLR